MVQFTNSERKRAYCRLSFYRWEGGYDITDYYRVLIASQGTLSCTDLSVSSSRHCCVMQFRGGGNHNYYYYYYVFFIFFWGGDLYLCMYRRQWTSEFLIVYRWQLLTMYQPTTSWNQFLEIFLGQRPLVPFLLLALHFFRLFFSCQPPC
jgi:hypothetical protein